MRRRVSKDEGDHVSVVSPLRRAIDSGYTRATSRSGRPSGSASPACRRKAPDAWHLQ